MQIPLTDKSKFQGSTQASHLRTSLSKVTGRKFKSDTKVCINMQTQARRALVQKGKLNEK